MEAKQIPDVPVASSSLRVIEIDPQTDLRWETLVTSVPASPSPVYHPAWLKVLEETYGCKPAHLAYEDTSGQVVGILPLFYRRGWRSGGNLTSVFSGPLAYDDQTRAALVQAAVERTRAEPGVQLHLKIMSHALDGLVDGMVGVPVYEIYLLALPERPDLLCLDPPIKRAINKATRLGVEVRHAQTEHELRAWYELYLQTTRKFGTLPNPYRYYKVAWQRLHSRGLLRLLLAEHIEAGCRRLLGGILLLLYGQTISFVSAGWREEDQALRPNDVLHWRAIQDGCTDGFRWYDLGDVDLGNQGLARFKSKWGAEARMVYDHSYPALHDGMSSAHDRSKNLARQLVRAAWRHLPTKAVGLLSNWYYALHF
jgi:serine/alanine adding enzyme